MANLIRRFNRLPGAYRLLEWGLVDLLAAGTLDGLPGTHQEKLAVRWRSFREAEQCWAAEKTRRSVTDLWARVSSDGVCQFCRTRYGHETMRPQAGGTSHSGLQEVFPAGGRGRVFICPVRPDGVNSGGPIRGGNGWCASPRPALHPEGPSGTIRSLCEQA